MAFTGQQEIFCIKNSGKNVYTYEKTHIHFRSDYAVGLCPILTTKLTTLLVKKSEFIGFFGTS
jgi:hypothetical protein